MGNRNVTSNWSLESLFHWVIIGIDIGYIDKEIGMKWIQETDEIGKMLAGLIKLKRNQTNLKP